MVYWFVSFMDTHHLYSRPSTIRFVRSFQAATSNLKSADCRPIIDRAVADCLSFSGNLKWDGRSSADSRLTGRCSTDSRLTVPITKSRKMANNEREIIALMFQRTNHRSARKPGKTSADCHPTLPNLNHCDRRLRNANAILWTLKVHARCANPFFFFCHGLLKPPRKAALCRMVSGHWILDKINACICNILVVARYRNGSDQLCICTF